MGVLDIDGEMWGEVLDIDVGTRWSNYAGAFVCCDVRHLDEGALTPKDAQLK